MTSATGTAPTDPAPLDSDGATELADGTVEAATARSADLERRIAADPGRFRVLTGDRPTGDLHLGHLLGSLANRVRLQDAGVPITVVIADYQVITDRDHVGPVRERVLGLLADYLAAGMDPERSVIFPHSAVPALHQLMLPLLSLVTDSELRRNPTVKAELADSGRPLSGLLLTYPVHQAADILSMAGTVVPVGRDQLPHLELTRVLARRFNERYGPVFAEPEPLLSAVPVLLGTDGRKMAKSRGNSIALSATADETAAALRRARTDSLRTIDYDPVGRPEVSSLLDLAAALGGTDPVALAAEIGDGGAAELKRRATEAVNTALAPLRARRRELVADPGYLQGVLVDGIARASATAGETLAAVRRAMGTEYLPH
ncbi:tryptophan--tRNA ligase [Nakamurella endophytica]|uniref:Tryptophan--tRNA ligase n=1 Tax=Nakamurella endophytica TaxID=1748367 RepID=A0A917WIM8_9ACTN|nr:tryptophan--tRNA ligase [Nakamurella endophytica]GGM07094.1 tryptophan--tRNA ligase [Nakamurella endophytica]